MAAKLSLLEWLMKSRDKEKPATDAPRRDNSLKDGKLPIPSSKTAR